MHLKKIIPLALILLSYACNQINNQDAGATNFDFERDLLLVHFDCKTDVDDLHTAAAFATLLSDPENSKINYHAVAGTYGIQKGLYVNPNDLFDLAFVDNWTDAHNNMEPAVEQVKDLVNNILANQGDIWIAEAGQSDFTAMLIKAVRNDMPGIKTSQRFHVVQHSNWNEDNTSPESLEFVKSNSHYQKIPDGNAVGNGSPGFRSTQPFVLNASFADQKLIEIWQLTIDISNENNGKEGRYNNEAIAGGGLDFSDLAEVCWILGLKEIRDTENFFELYAK